MPNILPPDDSPELKQLSAPASSVENIGEEIPTANWKARAAVASVLALGALVWIGASLRRDTRPPPTILNVAEVSPTQNSTNAKNQLSRSDSGNIKVHVAGRVHKPGVYALPANSRVEDAIRLAGGALKDGDVNSLNLAQWAEDGSRIEVPPKATPAPVVKDAPSFAPRVADVSPRISSRYVPRASSRASQAAPAKTRVRSNSTVPSDSQSPVDINRADAQELDRLPGVGPVTAQRILDYRKENGAFKSVDDLESVKGIGPVKLEKMRAFVTVR